MQPVELLQLSIRLLAAAHDGSRRRLPPAQSAPALMLNALIPHRSRRQQQHGAATDAIRGLACRCTAAGAPWPGGDGAARPWPWPVRADSPRSRWPRSRLLPGRRPRPVFPQHQPDGQRRCRGRRRRRRRAARTRARRRPCQEGALQAAAALAGPPALLPDCLHRGGPLCRLRHPRRIPAAPDHAGEVGVWCW